MLCVALQRMHGWLTEHDGFREVSYVASSAAGTEEKCMSKKIIKRTIDIITIGAIMYVIFYGYFIFFDKPTTPLEITSLYVKMGYAFLALFIILLIRIFAKK